MLSPIARPLVHRLVPVPNRALRTALQLVLGVALLALLAQVRLQIGPVPITGQTFGVLLVGAAYGAGLGAATLLAYLAVGAAGFGVFAGGGAGWATLGGPTGGYLVGFVVAATLIGYLAERGWDRSFGRTALAMLLGTVAIYAFGLLWLGQFVDGLQATLAVGLLPFLAGDAIKLALAVALLPVVARRLGRDADT